MREIPLLFSGAMVRALLDGRKSQTRRIVKPTVKGCTVGAYSQGPGKVEAINVQEDGDPWATIACPYGVPGDRLWVKETFRPSWDHGEYAVMEYRADGALIKPKITDNDVGAQFFHECDGSSKTTPWKPSIFMPRWASRLTLEVTEVRVQRVQEISEEDAKAEGVSETRERVGNGIHWQSARDHYRALWDSINGKKAPWESNPWVWAISFKRLDSRTPGGAS